MRSVRRGVTIALIAQAAILACFALYGTAHPVGLLLGGAYAVLADVLIVRGLLRSGAATVGWANAVTWLRCAIIAGVIAVAFAGGLPLAVTAGIALALDGVDGKVARATNTASDFGARFDMETDASLVLVLSLAASGAVGPWVVLLGAARYLLLAATHLFPRLAEPTPPRFWRKVVAAAQGVVLAVICTGLLPGPFAESLAIAAGLALAWSFGTQVHQLLATPRTRLVHAAAR